MSSCHREVMSLTLAGMFTASAVPRDISLEGPCLWSGEKGEKIPVGTESHTPASRCL